MTNENVDPDYMPDHVHSSSQNIVSLVYAVRNYTVLSTVSGQNGVQLSVQFKPITNVNNSYTYCRMVDSHLGLALTSVTRISDGKNLRLTDNVWRTQRTTYFVVSVFKISEKKEKEKKNCVF